ncbi:SGNH/GDSL hydrolase family protein [Aestuariivirga litoralis]|uniref:SGNH/GDSL hydrolase family protein n=1 Tax=Aestuariivirga litoralis TaxID=2650924 RepID=UPI0018C4E0D4|nr:DUF459 domain-containing protein [Aestuariivirga litoralis]MBG1233126.1 DUF459 domain-containing protein [Aestuariivirga litoralis]
MRLAFFSLLLVLWSGLAFAQDQAATPPTEAPPDDTRRVLIIGDQLAGGMGSGLARMAQGAGEPVLVTNRFNESSGLARPEIYDWAAAIPKMIEGKNFTSALVLMGLNDRRDMRDANGAMLKFGTPEWDTLYKTRIDAVIDALAGQNIQVLWMGEPPMGDPALDADMQNVTALIKERVEAKGAGFVDLRTPFLGPNGGYAQRGPDDTGADRQLRESDGVTFMKVGNNRLGQAALQALKSGPAPPASPVVATPDVTAPAAPAQTPPAQTAAVPTPPAAPVDDQGPIFGQEGDDNAVASTGSKDINAAVEKEKAIKKAASESIIGVAAAKGSSAEALFTKGIAPPPPTGRFDDFTAATP